MYAKVSHISVEEASRRSPGEEDASEKIWKILEQAKHEMHLSPHTSSEMCTTQRENATDSERLDPSSLSPTDFVQSIIQKVQHEINRNPYLFINPSCSESPPAGQGSFQTLPVDSEQSKQGFYNKTIPVHNKTPLEEGKMSQHCLAVESCGGQDQNTGLTLDCPVAINSGMDFQQFQNLELDTFSITKRVKDILTVNNLGEKT